MPTIYKKIKMKRKGLINKNAKANMIEAAKKIIKLQQTVYMNIKIHFLRRE
jgi:hypothetical protein